MTSASHVIFVNKLTGKRIFAANTIASDGYLTMSETGIEWKMATSASVGAAGSLAGQYCFNFEGAGLRYLNAGDFVGKAWGVLVFNGAGSPAKSSGWFFYPVTTTKTVTFAQPENGTVAVNATNGTLSPVAITAGSTVTVGTVATVNLTPASGYSLSSLNVNGTDVTGQVSNGQYQFAVNANAEIVAIFSLSTGLNNANSTAGVYPGKFNNIINVVDKVAGTNVYMFDVCGKKVVESTETVLYTEQLKSGIYFVKYNNSKGITTVKVIKE